MIFFVCERRAILLSEEGCGKLARRKESDLGSNFTSVCVGCIQPTDSNTNLYTLVAVEARAYEDELLQASKKLDVLEQAKSKCIGHPESSSSFISDVPLLSEHGFRDHILQKLESIEKRLKKSVSDMLKAWQESGMSLNQIATKRLNMDKNTVVKIFSSLNIEI